MKAIIILALICFQSCHCVPYCETNGTDSIFNVGHLIYIYRCGEVWTYDPRMDAGNGGFIRDSSVLIYWQNLMEGVGKPRADPIRFSGFSFQELTCMDRPETADLTCARSIEAWNHLTVLFNEDQAFTLMYGTEFVLKNNSPIGFKDKQPMDHNSRHSFWPNIKDISKSVPNMDETKVKYVAALYDPNTDNLFLALKHELYYCITYVSMREMLYDIRKWPRDQPKDWKPNWRPGLCFTGTVIGMFYHDNRAFVVGQVDVESRKYSDQVYVLHAQNGTLHSPMGETKVGAELLHQSIANTAIPAEPQTVRSYFGCNPRKTVSKVKRKKRSVRERQLFFAQEFQSIVGHKLVDNWMTRTLLTLTLPLLFYRLITHRMFGKLWTKCQSNRT